MDERFVFLLTDYKGEFYTSERRPWASMDVDRISRAFDDRGVRVEVMPLHSAPRHIARLRGRVCLYQGSEDVGLHYRSFIEDVILGLSVGGVRVVPRFEILRAHHNKVVQEVLRSTLPITGHEGPSARVYGTLDELIGEASQMRLPAVVKAAEGAGSRNVFLARSQDSLLQIARRMSRTWHTVDAGKEFVKRMVRPYHKRRSNHRGKFIVQEFVPDLTGDYKILVYGRRYYVLERRNRPSDFRASGSGRFSYPEAAPPGLLEAARAITCALKVPFVSLDVAVSNDRVYLLEWQGINFGNYTLERSSWHFIERDGVFTRQDGASELEEIVVEAVTGYCEANGYWTGQVEGLGSVDPAPRIIG